MKIVVNVCWGGYGLSKEAYDFLGEDWDNYGFLYDKDRANPKLVECVEKLGSKANGSMSELKIVEIPDGIEYEINDYDGIEQIIEPRIVWSWKKHK